MKGVPEDVSIRSHENYRAEIELIADQLRLPGDSLFRQMPEKMKGNFYVSYPYLFSQFYPSVRRTDIEMLTLAGNLYFSYLLIWDELIDCDTKSSSLPILHLLHERALEILIRIFPLESFFWNEFGKSRSEFLSVPAFEKELFDLCLKGQSPDERRLMSISRNKSAFAKCATAGLRALAGLSGGTDPLAETQDGFHAGLQLLDDLEDWKEDFLKRRPSYLLSSALSDVRLRRAMDERPQDVIGLLGRYIYYSGAAEKLIAAAKVSFENSLLSCERHDVPLWKELVKSNLLKAEVLEKDCSEMKKWLLEKRRASHMRHEKVPACLSMLRKSLDGIPLADMLSKAMAYLAVEQEEAYPEMTHRMAVPRSPERSYESPPVHVVGNIFQRTIVLEAFLDVNEMKRGTIGHKVIENELDFIEKSRVSTVGGGWSYFPGYDLIPPDSDDLAQVTRIAARMNLVRMRPFIDDAISLLLRSNRYPDGTFHTWILDPDDRGRAQEALQTAVLSYWGERAGKDIEVTSNLASALHEYDPAKFRKIVNSAVGAVIGAQSPDGTWPSVWYCGRYYGTYAAVRLLYDSESAPRVLTKTYDFLRENQSGDGGWGESGSDPLNTAFVLMSLSYLLRFGCDVDRAVLDRGICYLIGEQKREGSWRPVPFISMFVGGKNIIYRSETVTTAFVARSVMAVIKNRGFRIIRRGHERVGDS